MSCTISFIFGQFGTYSGMYIRYLHVLTVFGIRKLYNMLKGKVGHTPC